MFFIHASGETRASAKSRKAKARGAPVEKRHAVKDRRLLSLARGRKKKKKREKTFFLLLLRPELLLSRRALEWG
jgi:hypothetical protein